MRKPQIGVSGGGQAYVPLRTTISARLEAVRQLNNRKKTDPQHAAISAMTGSEAAKVAVCFISRIGLPLSSF